MLMFYLWLIGGTQLIREHYRDFGPTLAREKLEEFTVWSLERKPSDVS